MILVKLLTISKIPTDIGQVANLAPSIEEEPEAVDLNEEAPQDALPEEPAGEPEETTEDSIDTEEPAEELEPEATDEAPMEFSFDDPPPMDMAADVTDANDDPVTDDLDMLSQELFLQQKMPVPKKSMLKVTRQFLIFLTLTSLKIIQSKRPL